MLAFWSSVSYARDVVCADLAKMVSIGVPFDIVDGYVAGSSRRDEDPDCAAGLPETIRARYLELPVVPPAVVAPADLPTPEPVPMESHEVLYVPPPRWEPDDTTAFLMSATIGFGAGHYYAENTSRGDQHAITQLSALLVLGIGRGLLYDSSIHLRSNVEWETGLTLTLIGSTTLSVDRLVDAASTPRSVREHSYCCR